MVKISPTKPAAQECAARAGQVSTIGAPVPDDSVWNGGLRNMNTGCTQDEDPPKACLAAMEAYRRYGYGGGIGIGPQIACPSVRTPQVKHRRVSSTGTRTRL